MSLYGNIKKIETSAFQFDRVYSTRAEMDDNASSDGVYAGRYVLVEYGERFSNTNSGENIQYTGQPNVYYNTATKEYVQENEEFQEHVNTDLTRYGAVYDSTIWQKIYLEQQDKYVMIAELNAQAPKIDVISHDPLSYTIETNGDHDDNIYAGKKLDDGNYEIVKIINTKEKANEVYFDTTIDTELKYLMHYPKTLQLEASNNTINFNKNGFNAAYSYGEVDGPSVITFLSKGLEDYEIQTEIDANGKTINRTDANNVPLATLETGQDINTKMLYMNFPAFGNAMNTIYDIIYGVPDTDKNNLKHGVLRPYFRQFYRDLDFPNIITVIDNGNVVPVEIDGQALIVSGPIEVYDENDGWKQNFISYECTGDTFLGKKITPSFVQGKVKDTNGNFRDITEQDRFSKAYLCDTRNNPPKEIIWEMHFPTGDDDKELKWISSVPEFKDILKTSSNGLVSVLSSLFNETDPLNGTVKYYLFNDWTASTNGMTNVPAILNKPYTVGGYPVEYLTKEISLYALTDNGEIAFPKRAIAHNYNDVLINKNFSGGHYNIDFDTWQLVPTVTEKLDIGNTSDIINNNYLPISIRKLLISPNDINKENSQFNQDSLILDASNEILIIRSTKVLNTFNSTNPNQGSGQWVGLDINTGLESIIGISWNNYILTQDDVDEAASVGLPEGHIIFWVKANEISETNKKIVLKADGYKDTTFIVQYFGVNSNLPKTNNYVNLFN